jgi:hypothetical protein
MVSYMAEWYLFKCTIFFMMLCLDIYFLSTVEFEEVDVMANAVGSNTAEILVFV